MQNKQLRADENKANNIVIRKRAKAQIAVPIVKGEVAVRYTIISAVR